MLLIGCVKGDPNPQDSEELITYFSFDHSIFNTFETGEWGRYSTLFVYLAYYYEPFRLKWHFSGPGTLFEWYSTYDNGKLTYIHVPLDTSREYVGERFNIFYMPPASNDELLASGTDKATIVFSVLDPRTNEWVEARMTYYLSARYSPADYFLYGAGYDRENPTPVTISAGEDYKFYFSARNPAPGYDIQIQHELTAQGDYSGNKGQLTILPEYLTPPCPPIDYTFTYTAPENITSPTDIIATVSYYDTWVKERRKFEFTLHVVP
jgi:hypothetical protein